MIIVDDVLCFPFKSLLFLLREVHNAALQETVEESEAIRRELSTLYLELEGGRLTDDAFDARERALLDRLDDLEVYGAEAEASEDEDEGEDEDRDTEGADIDSEQESEEWEIVGEEHRSA